MYLQHIPKHVQPEFWRYDNRPSSWENLQSVSQVAICYHPAQPTQHPPTMRTPPSHHHRLHVRCVGKCSLHRTDGWLALACSNVSNGIIAFQQIVEGMLMMIIRSVGLLWSNAMVGGDGVECASALTKARLIFTDERLLNRP